MILQKVIYTNNRFIFKNRSKLARNIYIILIPNKYELLYYSNYK
jgi:hypothetical protein